ncbi:class I SAM-dependent methyltransferase [Devosia sp. XJ19-1]|uniref:Class I SAM-dependent methyltransferase n=1 Tax=Devosia ureilytica TaxID=2952754 RepID=A0A9Q4AQA1_9HYPH|nr:class I SAM-dependent methyltransferase [Devosia ureilytica]MCP8884763.1 class I SAM-dependent methyltransferase [Devosia ureilytica]MCP8888394.1 class I SAM-dependent methyltransferase [Devosia ureilytica]
MAELSTFWDKMADKYAAQPIADEAAYRTKLARTQSHFTPEMDIFEFGCGTGGTAITHAPHVRHVHAVDFSARMLDMARQKAKAAGVDNVTFEQGDITSLSIAPASYDMVLGLSILHLLKDRQAVIDRVFAILKPGGRFVSSTACIGDSMKWLGVIAPLGRAFGLLPMLNVMTHDQLRDSLTRAGFAIEHDWRPNPHAAVFIIARKPD